MTQANQSQSQNQNQSERRARRHRRWVWGVAIAVIVAVGLVLLFLLTLATNNRHLYEQHFPWLLALNTLVACFLLLVLLWMASRLLLRLYQGKFGSRLLLKLAGIFGLVGLLPGLLIYAVSYQFVSRSIESWFDVKVEGALTAGVTLASVTLDALAKDMGNNARRASLALADIPDASAGLELERLREQLGAQDVLLWSASGAQVLASAGSSLLEMALAATEARPSNAALRQLRTSPNVPITTIEGLDELEFATATGSSSDGNAYVQVLVSVPASLSVQGRFLQVRLPLPESVVHNALAVQEAHREYQERALGRQGLRRMYIGTLTLSLFLAVFGAVLLAVLLGQQLARPLLLLARGVQDVARGDLRPKAVSAARDELGGLTRSFALMTQQLLEARTAVDQGVEEITAARANLQTILDNLTAGVLVLSQEWRVVVANPGAAHILRLPLAGSTHCCGAALEELPGLESLALLAKEQFALLELDEQQMQAYQRWQHVLELELGQEGAQEKVTLVLRGALLPQGGRLLVFDDISEIVSAQRSKAWAEVARRVAHEIKNPLTPIQLSAQRLELKLSDKLPPAEQALLQRSVKMITDQVQAMLRLVNEFRDYARLPSAVLRPLDLNALVLDILQLYQSDQAEGGTSAITVELDPQCPQIYADAQQLRQVIHNLLQNAQDASPENAPVQVSTHWLAQAAKVRLCISDSGSGFAANVLQCAFEPYVTTKVRGTGLGLAVVKKIADEHGARIDLSNRLDEHQQIIGAQVWLSFTPVSLNPSKSQYGEHPSS